MMNMSNDKLAAALKKVTDLRALAARATTQAEAETAYAAAESIIAKYQIDVAQIEFSTKVEAEEIAQADDPIFAAKRRDAWIAKLAGCLARLHGCATCYYDANLMIAGRASDVAIVRYLFAWLHAEITRLSESEYGKAARNAFRHGAVQGAIMAMKDAQDHEGDSATVDGGSAVGPERASMAMVLTSRADESLKVFGKLRAGPRVAQPTDRGAYHRGVEAGTNLSPRAGLSGGGHRLLGGRS